MIDPLGGGQDRTIGAALDRTGGPAGVVKALVFLVALVVVVASVLGGLEAAVAPFLPDWAVLPVVVLGFAVVAVGGFLGVLGVMDRRRTGL